MLAAVALTFALWLTRPTEQSATFASERLGGTPERAAESFIDAYRGHAFARAAHFATGKLAQTLQAEAQNKQPARAAGEHEAFVVHESHRMEGQRLRLVGVLVRDGEAESSGKSVSLTLHKAAGRYLVEEIEW
jgi:hypothetical protein